MKIPFIDFRREYRDLKKELDSAVKRVINSGHYILGKEVEEFEKALADYIGVKYAVGVGNGTEALHLALLAGGVKPGDEVITAVNTCAPTISAIMACGAIPVLVDAHPLSYCLDSAAIPAKITKKTKAVIPVHLYGQMSNMGHLMAIGKRYNLKIIEDCAQASGAKYKNKMAGSFGIAGCFSFYPTKNIGALGDGGMISTNSRDLAVECRRLRNYGETTRYKHDSLGFNSRLDEIQAALLRVKLKKLDEWNRRRRAIAERYKAGIDNPDVILPEEMECARHVYHLFVIRVKRRDYFRNVLKAKGIPTLIHYPIPMYRQKFYLDLTRKRDYFPVADQLAEEIVSLPLYPYLRDEEVDYIIKIVNSYRPVK
ncbi:MAG: DegT/DnrJ/EryC1/StrS family aminotransferase [Candidatus Omnitrophota bacterium]